MPTADRIRLAKGFILNKMYFHGYVCRKTGHGKHTAVEELGKSCPSELKSFVDLAIQELKTKDRLLGSWPTSYGERVCAVASQTGYDLANAYNEYASLPLVEYGKPASTAKVTPLSEEELRKLKFKKSK
jgi:hypothetical protein